MEPNQNAGLGQAPQTNPAQPVMTEEQIRAMRGDLNQAPAAAGVAPTPAPMPEPQISIPTAVPAANTTKVIFDGEEPAFSPNTIPQMSAPVDTLIAAHGSKKMIWWLVGSVVVLALGAIGYFVVYPMLSTVTPEPEPVVVAPVAPVAPTPPAAPVRISAFTVAPVNKEVPVTLTGALSKDAITAALTKEGQTAQTGVTELVFAGDTGSMIPLGPFFSALAPGFTEVAKTNLLFADDFTAFVYKDEKGIWPGYVASLKTGFDAVELKAWFTALEKSPLKNFFMGDPGKMSAFKDGMINNKYPDRYATGAAAGASFGYVMLPAQGKVIISTSFEGLKEAVRLLGL